MTIMLRGPDGLEWFPGIELGDPRLPWWQDHMWLGPLFERGAGPKVVAVICDLCGNKEIGHARLLHHRDRDWLVYGYAHEAADAEDIVRRRVAMGEKPDPDFIEGVRDVFRFLGAEALPNRVRAPKGWNTHIVDHPNAPNPQVEMAAWCGDDGWFTVSRQKVYDAGGQWEPAEPPRRVRVGVKEHWRSHATSRTAP